MADDKRTDADAAREDGLDLFPQAPKFDPHHDEPQWAYRDMRAHWWIIKWSIKSQSFTATPTRATAEFYGIEPKRMFAAANTADGIRDAVEERIEAARASASSGGGWLVLLLVAAILLDGKGRRR